MRLHATRDILTVSSAESVVERNGKRDDTARGFDQLEGFARRDAVVAGDGEHEQAVGYQPNGHDAQKKVPDKGLLKERRQGTAEASNLSLVRPEGCQN